MKTEGEMEMLHGRNRRDLDVRGTRGHDFEIFSLILRSSTDTS